MSLSILLFRHPEWQSKSHTALLWKNYLARP
jgi:hypothetical protein